MKNLNFKLSQMLIAFGLLFSFAAGAGPKAPQVGSMAPDFELKGSDGNSYRLSKARNQWVVLEWFNDGCPFVKKHYESGQMQKLQKKYVDQDVVWFTIASSAPGKQGHKSPSQQEKIRDEWKIASTATLIDQEGVVGHKYGAKVTPHMYIINPQGVLVYQGAIDDQPSTDQEDFKKAKNYVDAALTEGMAKKPISTVSTQPYGCGVKYQ